MEEFTYEEIRAKALKQGVKDNIFQVGMWAQFNGYMKCKRSLHHICGVAEVGLLNTTEL